MAGGALGDQDGKIFTLITSRCSTLTFDLTSTTTLWRIRNNVNNARRFRHGRGGGRHTTRDTRSGTFPDTSHEVISLLMLSQTKPFWTLLRSPVHVVVFVVALSATTVLILFTIVLIATLHIYTKALYLGLATLRMVYSELEPSNGQRPRSLSFPDEAQPPEPACSGGL